MKTNWLWDSRLKIGVVKKILMDEKNPRFKIYAGKLISRVSDPKEVFCLIDKITFCRQWPTIKKRLSKDSWLVERVKFWQTIYENVYADMKEKGIKIRIATDVEVPPTRRAVAMRIRQLREKLGYTQKDLANKLGVIQQYISKIETGRENISLDTLKKIADVLGCSMYIKLG